jgi:hypothetical protein
MAYKLIYNNRGVRDLHLSPEVERAYELAAQAAGIDEIRVVSGGQESSGPNRTGSHRHDAGGAGDIQLVKNGRVLDFTNQEDLPYFSNFVSSAKGAGLTGFGAGTDYMGNSTIHAGGGTSAIWGAGGKGTNAPGWLQKAFGTTINSNPVTAPGGTAPITSTTTAPAAIAAEEPKSPYADAFSGLEEMIGGLQGKKPKQEPEIQQQDRPSIQPNTPNPQLAQMLMSQLLNKPRGLSLGGMFS